MISTNFEKFPNLIAVFSEKADGPIGSFSAIASQEELINRENFLRKNGVPSEKLVRAGMVHDSQAGIVSLKEAGKKVEKIDGLATKKKNLFLAITAADCLPIFFYDSQKEIIGLVHGGWRGLANGIIASTIEKMIELGAKPENISVFIGPGIGVCHYWIRKESEAEMVEKFGTYFDQAKQERESQKFLDLKKIAKAQLLDLGIIEKKIETSPECTACLPDRYFSHRRDQVEPIETMMAVIGIKN